MSNVINYIILTQLFVHIYALTKKYFRKKNPLPHPHRHHRLQRTHPNRYQVPLHQLHPSRHTILNTIPVFIPDILNIQDIHHQVLHSRRYHLPNRKILRKCQHLHRGHQDFHQDILLFMEEWGIDQVSIEVVSEDNIA